MSFLLLQNTHASLVTEAPPPRPAYNALHNGGLHEICHNIQTYSPELLISRPAAIREMLPTEPARQRSYVKLNGPDSLTRPIAVTFQRAFEQSIIKMLQNGSIKSATAIIHTDRPTTPLCNHNGKINYDSLPESVRQDTKRIKTIKDRNDPPAGPSQSHQLIYFVRS
ncbi:hypothetical protein GZ77_14180 [Endozoicomonas montiporae]|uniref:Uncharacterized protein n=2 Tax=Endozoicomonas montiporae TaxID=1027273 RepID=A0A081N4X9_9GAMM|nr:hypothetical protein [Endozoicomonas montiporae]AMO57629.1 hypothetical protein EZMO1_3666 [Endozoicomonas montiporae CL-33]KEQ13502.1 hypothetical protein GZ77_14180 [Endozoicomonas montiporae]